jgi:spermidine synthase
LFPIKNSALVRLLYSISFIEGGSVMAAEIMGAKMLAPSFGSSLYVWSTVMAITLGGLALGYFTGGFWAGKKKSLGWLLSVVILAGVFCMLMPFMAKAMLNLLPLSNFYFTIISATLIFLFPPVFLMGTISPMIIQQLSNLQSSDSEGSVSGKVFAISTFGGIMATFLFGFYIIPHFGLTLPSVINGFLLTLIPVGLLLSNRKFIVLIVPALGIFFVGKAKELPVKYNQSAIRYFSEGLLGQVMVVDYAMNDTANHVLRYLIVNGTPQTWFKNYDDEYRNGPYIDSIVSRLEIVHQKRALILGLGGGVLANKIHEKGYQVDAVELDERIIEVARNYFSLSKGINCFAQDARYFVKTCHKSYDLVIYDVFKGEENPSHLITLESLEELKKCMNDDALLIINSYGFQSGQLGLGYRSIARTLLLSGFNCSSLLTNTSEEFSNSLLFADLKDNNKHAKINTKPVLPELVADGHVLKDDVPLLEYLNRDASIVWRKNFIDYTISDLRKRNVPAFL